MSVGPPPGTDPRDHGGPDPAGAPPPAAEVAAVAAELEEIAGRLRSDGLAPETAAELVERCAELAGRLGASLEAQARAASVDPPAGQGSLL